LSRVRRLGGGWLALALGSATALGETPVGLRYEQVPVPSASNAHVLTVDPAHAQVRVLDARDHGAEALTAEQFAEATDATAVINASFFDVDGTPLGLLIVDGQRRNKLRSVDWGVFTIDGNGASIRHTTEWADGPTVRQALQSGPRLVVDGKALALKKQTARRTAVCVMPDGGIKLAVLPSNTAAAALAAFLEGLGCEDALNLDGGPSTQLHLQRAGIVVDEPGGWPVPVALGVFVAGAAEIQGTGCSGGCR
jgi:uncharacterized protein YigE (DUF2233 family)